MKNRTSLRALVTAAWLGLSACAAVDEADDGDIASSVSPVVGKGSICASGQSGSPSCVPSGGDPGTAFRGAQNNCSSGCAPYEMWPEFPAGMTLDQGIRSPDALRQLLNDVDAITSYARNNLSAEAYEHVLGGKLADVLRHVKDQQNSALNRPDPRVLDPLEAFEAKVRELHGAEINPINDDLAQKRKAVTAIEAIMADHKKALAAPTKAFDELVTRYVAFLNSEPKLVTDLKAFVERASKTALKDIPKLEVDVMSYARTMNDKGNQLSLDATRISTTFAHLESEYQARLAPHASFLSEHFGGAPSASAGAQRTLDSMTAYCALRRAQADAQMVRLLRGISNRRESLIAAAADERTRKTLRASAHLQASSRFLDEATRRNTEISKLPAKTTKYGFTLWADKYDQYLTFMELEPLCSSTPSAQKPTWRDTGCISLNRSFGRARTYMNSTIPQMIRLALPSLRSKGVAQAVIDEIQADLTAGRVREAALRHDAAARMTEEM